MESTDSLSFEEDIEEPVSPPACEPGVEPVIIDDEVTSSDEIPRKSERLCLPSENEPCFQTLTEYAQCSNLAKCSSIAKGSHKCGTPSHEKLTAGVIKAVKALRNDKPLRQKLQELKAKVPQ